MTEDPVSTPDPDPELFKSVCDAANALLAKVGGPVRRIAVQAGVHRVEIEWDPTQVVVVGGAPVAGAAGNAPAEAEAHGGYAVTAPLVGTFYRSPEPGAKAFVEIGDVVEAGQEIGIVEAMKIMNRIVTEQGGKVAEIVVNDADMVEFGQVLMYLAPVDSEG